MAYSVTLGSGVYVKTLLICDDEITGNNKMLAMMLSGWILR